MGQFGDNVRDVKEIDAWCCIKFDKKTTTYINSNDKGYKEDFDFEELEAAIEPCKEGARGGGQIAPAQQQIELPNVDKWICYALPSLTIKVFEPIKV